MSVKACRADEREIGYWPGRKYWENGYIPEGVNEILRRAFEDLKMNRVWCCYCQGNEKSKRVQEKAGFQYHHTEYNFMIKLLSEISDSHVACMSREQWSQKTKQRFD
ncbi:MAG: GNAT family N-acetyltransferase [Erysipelotrichaceae bacterium]|nr:GNAT family N-acetyltransferase [Erysipelotrichaceae bacterium]